MNIQSVNLHNFTPNFKAIMPGRDFEDIDGDYSYPEHYCCNDTYEIHEADPYGQAARDAMRNHIYERAGIIIPEYTPTNAKTIEDAKINNFEPLPNGAFRGASLANRPECVELLAKSGITTVIDLAGSFEYKRCCKANNLEYHEVNMVCGFWTNPIFADNEELIETEKNKLYQMGLNSQEFNQLLDEYKDKVKQDRRKFMDNFIKITDVINDGRYYIGCELGDYRTSNFLAMQSYFNPKWSGKKEIYVESYTKNSFRNMYKNLTPEDKTALGFTTKFEEKLKQRLGIKD